MNEFNYYTQTNIFKLIYSILVTLQAEHSSLGEGRKEKLCRIFFLASMYSACLVKLLGYNLASSYFRHRFTVK